MSNPLRQKLNEMYDKIMFAQKNEWHNSGFSNAGYWYKETPDIFSAQCNLMEKIIKPLNQYGRVLDVACGIGATSKYLNKYYPSESITGINISTRQLDKCRSICPDISFYLMDAACMQFDSAYFDNLICVESAAHFNTRRKFFSESYRILKPGGVVSISDSMNPVDSDTVPKENIVSSIDDYKLQLHSAGFSEVYIKDISSSVYPFFANHTEKFRDDNRANIPGNIPLTFDEIYRDITLTHGPYCLIQAIK